MSSHFYCPSFNFYYEKIQNISKDEVNSIMTPDTEHVPSAIGNPLVSIVDPSNLTPN